MLVDHQALVEKLVGSLNAMDREAQASLLTTDFVAEWPQSGERIRGIDNMWATVANYPGRDENAPHGDAASLRYQATDAVKLVAPACTVVSVEGGGSSGVAVWRVNYPDGSRWWVINLYHLRDGRIDRMTSFFAPEFPAPAWRAAYVERMTA